MEVFGDASYGRERLSRWGSASEVRREKSGGRTLLC